MKKRLLLPLLGLVTAFVIGSSSLAMAATVTTQWTPAVGDTAVDNGLDNKNETGLGSGTQPNTFTDGASGDVSSVIKSDAMNNKFTKDGTQVKGAVAQRTHGEYQNNTNSCASCHQTHTGAGDALIFKDTVFDTCTACHDGTLGFYNVFSGSTAGTFGGTPDGNASVHMAKGTMQVSAAPGGANLSNDGAAVAADPSSWGKSFNCASCHSPHGSYSDRLLNFNPNDVARTSMSEGGELVTGQVYSEADLAGLGTAFGTNGAKFVTATMTAANADVYPRYPAGSGKAIVGATLADVNGASGGLMTQPAPIAGTDKVVVVLTWRDMTTQTGHPDYQWVRDTDPWVNGHEYNETFHNKMDFAYFIQDDYRNAVANPAIQVSGGKLIDGAYYLNAETVDTGDVRYVYGAKDAVTKALIRPSETGTFTFSYQNAFAKVNGAVDFTGYNAYVARARVTKLAMQASPTYFGGDATTGVAITKVDSSKYDSSPEGVAISTFCASCHTDYLATSSNEEGTGIWTKAFRHTTTSANYTCLKCHFAHGSDVTVILDAQDRDIATAQTELSLTADQAKAYLKDVNPSSALKRYTNQAVCWKCHTSSHSTNLMNNDYVYNVNTDAYTANDITSGFKAPAAIRLPY